MLESVRVDISDDVVRIGIESDFRDDIEILSHLDIIPEGISLIILILLIEVNETVCINLNPCTIKILIIELVTRCDQCVSESHVFV